MKLRARPRLLVALGLLGASLLSCLVIYGGGGHSGPGTIATTRLSDEIVAARAARQQAVIAEHPPEERARAAGKQILFGDLHVHTTFSVDAFMMGLPLVGGEGAHPPADACDYARHCSSLDFFSLNDHAEGLTPQHWRETLDTLRQCGEVAGDPSNPDLVAFAGWEWTQVGRTPAEHYGHKNVILRDLDEASLPARPIAAPGVASAMRRRAVGLRSALMTPIREFSDRGVYLDYAAMMREIAAVPICPKGVDTRELPADCREIAETPRELFAKLARWGGESLVIPHGTTWGLYTPAGYAYDKQLAPSQHDPARQRLIEVYSGHGNSEEHRPFRALYERDRREPRCPKPRQGFEACCWRAGEIVRSRCGDLEDALCEHRVQEAREAYRLAGLSGYLTIPDATLEDWGDCDSCPDCFNPSMAYRPGGSAQYILAKGYFGPGEHDEEDDEDVEAVDEAPGPHYAPMGFIASSDNHTARPGTGYKELGRRSATEARGFDDPADEARIRGQARAMLPPVRAGSRRMNERRLSQLPPLMVANFERQASFFMTGGLVAAHAEGRDRSAIWDALQRREVYGTSGERILLWFDLVNAPEGDGVAPMGSELTMEVAPRFVVRAAGAFAQEPGCPPEAAAALGEPRLQRLCGGECYNPGDTRRAITRVEIIRIQPQINEEEKIERLIDDPWKVLPCEPDPAGCRVEFSDPSFQNRRRYTIYYARAIQEPTPAINAGGVRCERDEDGQCVRAHPCHGDFRTDPADECLSENEERAWSSPIFLWPGPDMVPTTPSKPPKGPPV